MIELNKIAREVEDIERDITGKNLGSKRYPWDRMADAIKSIANRAGATLPDKKYSTKKAFIADALEAIADMDFPRISVPDNDVRFIDYDGTVLYSYSADDFLQMTAMPANPDHTGGKIPFTSQGWNWSFEDAQAYVSKYGKLNVGQMYIPSDGKTHMILDVGPRLTIPLMIQQTVSEGVTINWGDGSEEETIEGTGTVTTSHTYETEGEYEITLDVADGCTLDFGGTVDETACNVFGESAAQLYSSVLKKIFIGNCVVSVGNSAFISSHFLINVTLPKFITAIGEKAFSYCFYLNSLTIPNTVTSIGQQALRDCLSIANISLTNEIESIGQMSFYNCYSLNDIIIPNSITSIEQMMFMGCTAITSLIIPDGVTNIDANAFANLRTIYTLFVLAETPPTLFNSSAFGNLPTDCTIYVPHGKGDTYKAASGWSTWASQIQELPE